jgi:hypothetical protein
MLQAARQQRRLECYKPPVSSADPAALPICLLSCTNNAMICTNKPLDAIYFYFLNV